MAASAGSELSGAAASRLVVRAISKMGMARALRWQAVTGTSRIDCLLIQVVLSSQGFVAGEKRGAGERAVSALAVAQSMGLSYETVRRRIGVLGEAGLLARAGGGWIVAAPVLDAWWAAGLPRDDAAALVDIVAALAGAGHGPSRRALVGVAGAEPMTLAGSLLNFLVVGMADFTALYGDLMSGTVAMAITAANVRHIVNDPEMARRWAGDGEVPPDRERRPVTLRALARELELPFETVRRRAATLVRDGIAEDTGDGLIVPARFLTGADIRRHNLRLCTAFERMLAEIAAG